MKIYIQVYNFLFLMLAGIIILLSSCENKITAPERIINQPGPVEVYAVDNSITVKFFGNNIEEGFAGYNIYISKNSGIINQNLSPVQNSYGSTPTLLYGSAGCFPNASEKTYVTVDKDSSGASIIAQEIYYVAISANVVIGDNRYNSNLTEEVAVTIRAKGGISLNNQQISDQTNDGVIFNSSGEVQFINVSNSFTLNGTGDVFFKLQDIDGYITPVLSVESNNNQIQDMGYVGNMDEFNDLPAGGYIENSYVTAIENHLYILHKKSVNKYIKIYISQIDGTISAITSDVILWFDYAY